MPPDTTTPAPDVQAQIDAAVKAYRVDMHECEQIAGRALGYPRYADDAVNFPDATDADGVCVGEHVAPTIVAELATAYEKAKAELDAAVARERDRVIGIFVGELQKLHENTVLDCGDNSCLFATRRGGMRTNGGCRCIERLLDAAVAREREALQEFAEVVQFAIEDGSLVCRPKGTLRASCMCCALKDQLDKIRARSAKGV